MTQKFRMLAVCLAALAILTGSAIAQVLYGNLVGTVTDQSNAAVVGATITIRNDATGFTSETKTDERGNYDIRNIPPGTFDVKITSTGFNTYEAKGIAIEANNVARIDAPMKLGNVAEVITVGAEAAMLQTDKSDLHKDFDSKELSQIPVSGYRNFQSMLDFVPGATPAAFQNASTDSPARALTTNINGTARNSNNTRIDGAASVFTWLPHHALYVPPLESIETVNVSTNNFDAEQGMSGGAAVNVITKSGTNKFHAVAFWYHSNHLWGAKNLFFNPNTPAGSKTPQRIDNQGGGTFGGPVIKDKLFFFTSWERSTTAERGTGFISVPTAILRTGNFDGFTTVYDPATGDTQGRGRTAFPGNIVPASRFSPQAINLQNLIPLPNTGSGQTNNYFANSPFSFKRDMVDFKMDYRPNSKMNIFGKYSVMIAPVSAVAPLGQALGGFVGGTAGGAGIGNGNNKTDIFGGGISYVLSPTIIFDANFGGTLMHHDTTGPDYGTNIGTDVLKIPGTNGSDIRQSGFPVFNISGYTGLGNQNTWSPVVRNDRVYTYVANMAWSKGSHSIRFGLDYIQHQMNHWQPELGGWSPRGGFNFVNATTGLNGGPSANAYNAYASFLLGIPGSMGKAYQFYDPMQTREFQQGYYIRDNWQVNRKLNVTLGLRMEHYPIMNRGQYGIERWDPLTNKVLIGGRGNVPRSAGTDAIPLMFGPRVGLAYRLNDKTVLRAGYGITNDPYPVSRPLRSPYPAVIIDEYIQTNSYIAPVDSAGRSLTLATGIPQAKLPDLTTGVLDIPNTISTNSLQAGKFRRGYIQSFNLTMQREIGAGFTLTAGYVGTRSIRQALTYFEANAGLVPGAGVNGRPYFNQFGVTTSRQFFIPMANNSYNGLQANLTRRFSNGIFLTSSYTWSKTIGLNAGNSDQGLNFYVPSQYSKNRGVASFDRTQVFQTAITYHLPFGKGKQFATSGVASALLGGWQINPTISLYSGTPFIVSADGGSLNAPQNTQVADQVNGTVNKLGGVGLGLPYYDPTAFKAVSEPRFGNMGIYAIRGPGAFISNMGLFRSFAVKERYQLQFRAEALNWTNTPRLANPNANVSTTANFMAITSADQQRNFRFGLRLSF